MFEGVLTPKDIEEKMKEFRNTNFLDISANQFGKFAKCVASIIPQEGGMRRGIINRLGELWAWVRFGLELMPEGNRGYDARDPRGRLGPEDKRYQIKSRHPEKGALVNPAGTTPRFTSLEFDRALLVLMDKDLQNYEIWVVPVDRVKSYLRPKRDDMQIQRFQNIGQRIYPC